MHPQLVKALKAVAILLVVMFIILLFLNPDNAQAVFGWVVWGFCTGITWVFSSVVNLVIFIVVAVLVFYFVL